MNVEYCPECNTELTRSIVGYLCHGCGSVKGFEKLGSALPTTSAHTPTKVHVPLHSKFAVHQPEMHAETPEAPKTLTHHVKKFVVPQVSRTTDLEKTTELSAPVDEQHLLSPKVAETAPVAVAAGLMVEPEVNYHAPLEFSQDTAQNALSNPDEDVAEETNRAPISSYLMPAVGGILVIASLIVAVVVLS